MVKKNTRHLLRWEKFKWYLFWGVLIFIVLILSSLFASFTIINDASGIITPMALFINKNKMLFLVWHIFLYISIFTGLYLYAKRLISKHKYDESKKKEAIIFCFLGVTLVIAIDSIYYLGR